MKSHFLILSVVLLSFGTACYDSQIDDKPAASVGEAATTSQTAVPPTSTAPTPGSITTAVIKEKSAIEFVGAKVTADHEGKFHNFDGRIEYVNAKPSRIMFDIDIDSLETDNKKLDAHLKTADFFDVARYPKATFTSTSLTEAPAGTADGSTHILKGNLDLHGVTREVTIPVKAAVTPEGVRTMSEFTINRHDWGVSYRGAVDDLIKDNVLIKLNLLFPPPPAA